VLKVLHLIDSGGIYGSEAVLLTLMGQSARLGISPLLGSMTTPDGAMRAVEAEALRQGFTVRRFPAGALPRRKQVGTMIRTIEEERIDIVHTHGYKPNIVFGLFSRPARPAVLVATLHGWCSARTFSKLRIFEWLESRALTRFDGIAVVSSRMLEHKNIAGRDLPLLKVIHNAVPLEPPGPRNSCIPQDIESFCRQGFTFGAIGRLSREKDFATLVDAFALLCRGGADSRLLILGEGPERAALEERIERLGLADRVLLPGYVDGARRCLPLLDAYVLSSTTEGMPMTILEAFAEGIPVVATAVGDVPQMLDQGGAGLLVSPGDAAGLANAMGRLLENPAERRRLADASSRRSEVYNSAGAMAEAYRDFYQLAISAAGREPDTVGRI
jgi:glycosyltransferase involved in cell wall biosynthesis